MRPKTWWSDVSEEVEGLSCLVYLRKLEAMQFLIAK
jgi:hypothetical protein